MTTFDLSSFPQIVAGLQSAVVAGQQIWITTIEGECLHCGPRFSWHHQLDCAPNSATPPERFRVLDKPCSFCGGDGFTVEGPNYHDPYGNQIPCLDCGGIDGVRLGGGREVWEFHTTCPKCHGLESGMCNRCFGAGSVLVCRATCRVVPVVLHDGSEPDDFDVPCLCVHDAGCFLHVDHAAADHLKLDPLPVPGRHWGLVFEIQS